MLVITFGRAASQELRERVREQLVEAERALAGAGGRAGATTGCSPGCSADEAERPVRHQRVRDALAAFDAATIATTHQFCQLVLRSLGVAGDTDAGATLVESLDDLVVEVVDDLYLRRFGNRAEPPPFDRAGRAGPRPQGGRRPAGHAGAGGARRGDRRRAPGSSFARGGPRRGRAAQAPSRRAQLRRPARAGSPRRSRTPTRRPATGCAARWRIVLVDEFQDTDPVQWQVLDRAFAGARHDGADRRPQAGDLRLPRRRRRHLPRGRPHRRPRRPRWPPTGAATPPWSSGSRSCCAARRWATRRSWSATSRPGTPAAGWPARRTPRRSGCGGSPRDGFRLSKSGLIPVGVAREHIARDCAADIAELLASGATWDGRPARGRPTSPSWSGRARTGCWCSAPSPSAACPAVVAGGGHVLQTPAADDWLALLEAIEQPHRSGRVRAAALTGVLRARPPPSLDAGGDELTDRVADTLRGWALLLRGRGVAALFEAAEERGLTARVLADQRRRAAADRPAPRRPDRCTSQAVRERLGPTALLQWLREERLRVATSERTRRLDSDAAAVQIVTIHASKGLQYPVVYLPFVHAQAPLRRRRRAVPRRDRPAHPRRQRRRARSGPTAEAPAPGRGGGRGAARALRRPHPRPVAGRHVVGAHRRAPATAACTGCCSAAGPATRRCPTGRPVRDDEHAAGCWAGSSSSAARSSRSSRRRGRRAAGRAGGPRVVRGPGVPTARVDADWRRTSYSGPDPGGGDGRGRASEPEAAGLEDEEPVPRPDRRRRPPAAAERRTRPGLADGRPARRAPAFGSPGARRAGARRPGGARPARRAARRGSPSSCAGGRPTSTRRPARRGAGAAARDAAAARSCPGHTLGRVPLRDRLRELDFEFPLAGGDVRLRRRRGAPARPGAAAARRTCRPTTRWRRTPPGWRRPPLGDQPLRGYLSGSIDVVLRTPAADDGATATSSSTTRPTCSASPAPC